MQDSAKNPRHVAGMGRPWRQTEWRCHCQLVHPTCFLRNTEKEGGMGTKGGMGRQTDRRQKKKGWKEGEYDVRREKIERGASKQTKGGRQVPGGYAGDRGVRRRRGRKMDEAAPPAECPSQTPVSDSSALLWAQWGKPRRTAALPLHFSHTLSPSYIQTSHIAILPPLSLLSLSLPLSRSLGAIFTSKPLHYLPSLRAIRNGVTLSGRHGHGIITTHPLSWGPLWGPPTLMERILGPPYLQPEPPPLHIPPAGPLLLTGKLWSKTVCN